MPRSSSSAEAAGTSSNQTVWSVATYRSGSVASATVIEVSVVPRGAPAPEESVAPVWSMAPANRHGRPRLNPFTAPGGPAGSLRDLLGASRHRVGDLASDQVRVDRGGDLDALRGCRDRHGGGVGRVAD